MTERKVRVRFAPSPTGALHIGGVRTALFNYLFARKHGGDFLLRIEDTDQTRYVPGAENYIIESLRWCNINFNEGVTLDGPYGPYRQSDRKPIYKQYADKLITDGYGYYAFDTSEELDEMRKKLEAAKSTSMQYDSSTRMTMRNSLTMPESEVQEYLTSGKPYVIRMKIPENENIHIYDLIRGDVVFASSLLDDKVLYKSDGMPTYHLANVVDDYLMKISHVIRGEEWLPSTPLHVLLYRYLGWEDAMPQFAHLPLLLKPDGKGKLSKRDGDRLGFPVFPLQWTDPSTGEISSGYREAGYFADAFINFLALLGWNPGTEQEIFSMDELVEVFTLEKVSKSGAKFDHEKAKWFNSQYLRKKSIKELTGLYQTILKEKGINATDEYVATVCEFMKERVQFVKEFWEQSFYFFERPKTYDEKIIKKNWKENTSQIIADVKEILANIESFDGHTIETAIKSYVEQKQIGFGQVMNPLRLCLVGSSIGPEMIKILETLGKKEVIERIDVALNVIKN